MDIDQLLLKYPESVQAYLNRSVHLVLIQLDAQLKVIACNRKFKSLLQRRKGVLGQPIWQFLISESYDTLKKHMIKNTSVLQLNFKTLSSSLFTLQTYLFKTDESYTLFGEHASLENDEILKTMAELNGELTNITRELARKNRALKEARKKIKVLGGLLPICSWCKKIKDDKGYWSQLENFIDENSEAEFSHSICPECMKERYPDLDDDDEYGE